MSASRLRDRHDTERMEQLVSSSNYSFVSRNVPYKLECNQAIPYCVVECVSNLSHKIEDIMADGDKVAVRVINTGTHKGEFLGMPPTDKKISFVGVGFLTIRDGKIVEQWSINDTMGLMQLQIGAMPPAPSSSDSSGNTHLILMMF